MHLIVVMGAPGRTGRLKMSKLSPYVNEIISFVVMLLLLVALVSSQLGNPALQLAGASDDNVETTHIRLEGE